jgi:TetR/AcrR family transcriptional regulator, transcriptional repressor of aconitase
MKRRGELAPDLDPDALARIVVALRQGLMLQAQWDGETWDHEAVIRTLESIRDTLKRG